MKNKVYVVKLLIRLLGDNFEIDSTILGVFTSKEGAKDCFETSKAMHIGLGCTLEYDSEDYCELYTGTENESYELSVVERDLNVIY